MLLSSSINIPPPPRSTLFPYTTLFRSVRHVYMNAQHSQNPKPSWYGESIGRYEGDTLVVDTIGISEKTLVDNFGTRSEEHTSELQSQFHLVCRLLLEKKKPTMTLILSS